MAIKICSFCNKEFKTKWLNRKFCSHKCYSNSKIGKKRNIDIRGSKNPNWRGGRRIDKDGYILIYALYHPYCNDDGYVREHRLIVEKILKRFLTPEETVHHIDGDKANNCPSNLYLFSNKKEHDRFEMNLRNKKITLISNLIKSKVEIL